MDLKLFGCGFVALTSTALLIFDYLTFEPPTQTLAAQTPSAQGESTQQAFHQKAEKAIHLPAVAMTDAIAAPSSHGNPKTKSSPLSHSPYAGILRPKGFSRPGWTPQNGGLAITTKPFETQSFVVMIDPGHGGSDPGARSYNGLLEKHLTLDIAKRMRLYLSKYPNIEVMLTREADYGLSRDLRIQKIKKSKADMLISLHFNNLPQTNIALVETYYAGRRNIKESRDKQREGGEIEKLKDRVDLHPNLNALSFTQSSQRLASILQQHTFSEVSSNNSIAENAGVKNDTLFVLTRSYKPSALVEITCLSNPTEALRLEDEEYRDRLSVALAKGILEYRESTTNTRFIDPGKKGESLNLVRFAPGSKDTKQAGAEPV